MTSIGNFGISITWSTYNFSDVRWMRIDRLVLVLNIALIPLTTMADTEDDTAGLGDVEFCTLGMFILGMLISSSRKLADGMLTVLPAQMTLTLEAPGQMSRTCWVVRLLLPS